MLNNILEAAYDYSISKENRTFAYSWLNSWQRAERNIVHFTAAELTTLIVYEVNNKRRHYVVNRLLARLSKLTRQREWRELQKIMEGKNERTRNRAISMSTRIRERRDRDKANVIE